MSDWIGTPTPLGADTPLAAPAEAPAAPAAVPVVPLAAPSFMPPWAGLAVDAIVMGTFLFCVVVVLLRGLPDAGAGRDLAMVMLSTVSAMALSTVNYWRGSSAGSARKTELLASERAS